MAYIGKVDPPSDSMEGDGDDDGKTTKLVVKCFACGMAVTDGDDDEEDDEPVAHGLCNQCECPVHDKCLFEKDEIAACSQECWDKAAAKAK
jgi:hypothetical protein